jgi:hypothetical protein
VVYQLFFPVVFGKDWIHVKKQQGRFPLMAAARERIDDALAQ